MNSPEANYQKRISNLELSLSLQKRRLQLSSLMRLLIFGFLAGCLYYAFTESQVYLVGVLLLFALFLFLVSRHQELKYEWDKTRHLIDLNKTELEVLQGNFSHLPDGMEFRDSTHGYSDDLDLFGKASFFQYINRTGLESGREELARRLTSNDIKQVSGKQVAIQELARQMEWRQEYTVTSRLLKSEIPFTAITEWFEGYEAFIPRRIRWLPLIYSSASILVSILLLFGVISFWWLVLLFFGGLLLNLPYLKRIQRLSDQTAKIQNTFLQLKRLVALVESAGYESSLLAEEKKKLQHDQNKVSQILREFDRLLAALDQRNNLLVAVIGNGFFLWDLRQVGAIEKWIANYGKQVPVWFSGLSGFDAWNSLANFAYNHPGFSFPLPKENGLALKVEGLAHPLLPEASRVANDLNIGQETFYIITGANMAGKSTFLRTLGLALLMANTGLPVCAASMEYKPIPLISSMRTTDSLSRSESYFFAELKRLKQIVQALEGRPYFVILDEILKGTNSKDKAAGSRQFVKRLLNLKAVGVIATHDLSLCELADEMPQVENYFFDVQIREGELFFDYRLQQGICTNMNASYLLRKMGIISDNKA